MIRFLFLLLFAPLWLPFRFLGWLRFKLGNRSTLRLSLTGHLPDVPPRRGLSELLRRDGGPHLLGVLEALALAQRDPKLSKVLVRIDDLECGLGRAEEVRRALGRVRAAGKTVLVHADQLGLTGYWVALGASRIVLSPQGSLDVTGVAMEFTLLKGLLDRAGIRAQLGARGAYKSMREMFSADTISDANREMMSSLVADLSGQLVSLMSEARGKSEEVLQKDLAEGPFRASDARDRGLIDEARYWDEVKKEVAGEDSGAHRLDSYRRAWRRRFIWPRRRPRVALVRISGNIRSGKDRQGPFGNLATGDRSLGRAVRAAVESKRVKAILLRVDSPGGSALASDLMWRELSLAAQKKPVFVSMANVAASGGYYASGLQGVPVWANSTTLTGSIGVVGGKFEISGLLERLGVKRALVGSNPRAHYHSGSVPWGEEELAKLERDLDASYHDFVAKMAEARGLPFEALERVARGRVWTGRQAREVSLVDHLGGLDEARLAIVERLGLAPSTDLEWATFGGRSRLGSRPESDVQALLDVSRAWAELPELGEALGRALDLRGERLFFISLIQPRSGA